MIIDRASMAEVMLSGVFSLHASHRGRHMISCPRAKVWLKKNRHSLAEAVMEEGMEMAVDVLNALSHSKAQAAMAGVAFLIVIILGGVLAVVRRR
jgi:hypothetical protein